MTDYRCKKCHKLLFKYIHGTIVEVTDKEDAKYLAEQGQIEITCTKCKAKNRVRLRKTLEALSV